ncbi:hypothetical protein RINTHM_10050 [Richelia intracellularis HM01]|nr:hypothetical protein RINTHM_10050 [Richelia intracellularis HM01]
MISSEKIIEISQVNQMYAVLGIYQSDIQKIKVGEKVLLISGSILLRSYGIVERVSW